MSIRVDKFEFKDVRDGGFRNNEMKRTKLKNTTQPLFCHYFTITFPITKLVMFVTQLVMIVTIFFMVFLQQY